MKRISVDLPNDLGTLLEFEQRRRAVAIDEIVRDALTAYLVTAGEPKHLSFIGIGQSGQHDTAGNIDAILALE